jgi:CheY-like chemotaxis protein
MATVLVVDDSPVDRHRVGGLLEKHPGWKVVYAADGQEALGVLEREAVDVALADLRMPGMNGLELVEAVKGRFPTVPVILMTAFGSEDIAILALQRGAASYVPKRNLSRQLHPTVASVLDLTGAQRGREWVMSCLERTELSFRLDNDLVLLPHLVNHLRDNLVGTKLCDDNEALRVSVALREALTNAILHGNLELATPAEQGPEDFERLVAERSQQPPYRDRHVHLTVRETRREVVYVIRDDGPGFDTSKLPAADDPAAFEKFGDRGLTLIRAFMDEVRFNEAGNEITLVKRCRLERMEG